MKNIRHAITARLNTLFQHGVCLGTILTMVTIGYICGGAGGAMAAARQAPLSPADLF